MSNSLEEKIIVYCDDENMSTKILERQVKGYGLILDYRRRGKVAVKEFVADEPEFCRRWRSLRGQLCDKSWKHFCWRMGGDPLLAAIGAAVLFVLAAIIGGAIS